MLMVPTSFALLSLLHILHTDAMNAYDNHVVQKKGKKTKKSDLNLPEQWSWLFENNKEESPDKKKKRKRDSSR